MDLGQYPFSLEKPGDLWQDVNAVVRHFAKLEWVPKAFPAQLASHKIDAEALAELDDDDLRVSFFIENPQEREAILQYIDALFQCTFQVEAQMMQEEAALRGAWQDDDELAVAEDNVSDDAWDEKVEAIVEGRRIEGQSPSRGEGERDDGEEELEEEEEESFEYNFIENALAGLHDEWEREEGNKERKRNL